MLVSFKQPFLPKCYVSPLEQCIISKADQGVHCVSVLPGDHRRAASSTESWILSVRVTSLLIALPCWHQDLLHVNCSMYMSEVRPKGAYRFVVLRVPVSNTQSGPLCCSCVTCGTVEPVVSLTTATPSWLARDMMFAIKRLWVVSNCSMRNRIPLNQHPVTDNRRQLPARPLKSVTMRRATYIWKEC